MGLDRRQRLWVVITVSLSLCLSLSTAFAQAEQQPDEAPLPPLTEIQVTSTRDGSKQPVLLWAPATATRQPAPLFVYLHSWSGNYTQKNSDWQRQAVQRGWIFLHPNFRGINEQPEACGSQLARQDILDAIDHVSARYKVDTRRIYLAGTSGGGHMSMLMAGYHPERFSAVSAWVGISDLKAWHEFQADKPTKYAAMLRACCGGAPGTSAAVDAEFKSRSPLTVLHRAGEVPLDINAGVTDGKTGSVPIHHSLRAYNILADLHKERLFSEAEMDDLWNHREQSALVTAAPQVTDGTYGRNILVRRQARTCRVTIFDGGHEGLPAPACAWLATQQRETTSPRQRDQ